MTGVNTTIEGQGQAVLKAATDVGTALSGVAERANGVDRKNLYDFRFGAPNPPQPAEKGCKDAPFIEKGKDITVKYVQTLGPGRDYAAHNGYLSPDAGSVQLHALVAKVRAIPRPMLTVTLRPIGGLNPIILNGQDNPCKPPSAGTRAPNDADQDTLCLQHVQTASIIVSTESKDDVAFAQNIAIPDGPSDMAVPIPASQLFGKQTTSLVVADSGAITSVGYAKTTGAAAALGAIAGIITFGATR